MNRRTLCFALGCAALTAVSSQGALARSATCLPITQRQVAALFDTWNTALATKNPAKVTATYADDASLLPTLESGPYVGHQEIEGYFEHFLLKSPIGKIDKQIIKIGCNVAWDIGLYTFTVDNGSGGRKDVHARYTFIYAPEHGHWLIVHHHSSLVPPPE